MSNVVRKWHDEVLELNAQGLSGRKIANALGLPKSTVNDFLRKHYDDIGKDILKSVKDGPRILVYDIETAPMLAHVWKMWDNNVGLNQLVEDWYILSFAAKWLGEDEIFYYDQRNEPDQTDDSFILSKLWDLLNEADFVIGQNIKKFDTKKVNARFIMSGFPKPSTYRQIDTMLIARDQLGMTSNKLEYLAGKLCPEHVKSKHSKFPGHEMWVECMKGNIEAWEEMEAYNRDDILATEALYNVLSSWDSKLPNFDVYVDGLLDMSEWEHCGYVYSQLAKYKRYRNKVTGQQRRSRVNELTREKRDQLLANIV